MDGKPRPEQDLFEKKEEPPLWATVNLKGIKVEGLRHFGEVYLGLALWRRLGLHEFCSKHIQTGREEVFWSIMACILVLARFCDPSSELQIAESWYKKTALDDLLGVSVDKINNDRLYRALDALLPHKDALCKHLQDRYEELFGIQFDFLFYDITSTYFEGSGENNPQAKRGYSRDSRSDSVQVCIGLVVSREGLPLALEIFDGNRTDVTTVEDIVKIMEEKYGKAESVWVIDRGMVSEPRKRPKVLRGEENLSFLRERKARYLVGTPKSMLKRFEKEMIESDWEEVQAGIEVKLCPSQENTEETFILCRSSSRKEKEVAILNRFITRLEAGLTMRVKQAKEEKIKDRQKVERRIGRLLERNSRASSLFKVSVEETRSGKEGRLTIKGR